MQLIPYPRTRKVYDIDWDRLSCKHRVWAHTRAMRVVFAGGEGEQPALKGGARKRFAACGIGVAY